MIVARTARAVSAELSARVKKVLRRALDDLGFSAAQLAQWVGVDASIAEDWCREASTRHVPLHLLAHPKIPRQLRARLAADVWALAQETCSPQSRESAVYALLRLFGEGVAVAATALADGRIEDHETEAMRPVFAKIRDGCDRWLLENSDPKASARGVS